jgi:Domain of unknown function (DUF4226)
MTANPPADGPASDHQQGDAADAIRSAEVALAKQNSATAQVDLQVVTAVLNAHERSLAGGEALDKLQHEIEAAVTTRSDLDTPAGARDFQRYLIGKLRDIRSVVATASLDDTSNSALMAAWTSLYNSAKPDTEEAQDRAGAPTSRADQSRPPPMETGLDPYFDALPADDPGGVPEEAPAPSARSAAPTAPDVPTVPSFGGAGVPGGWSMPGGLPLSAPLPANDDQRSRGDIDNALAESDDPADTPSADDASPADQHVEPAAVEPPASGPTTVTLPNGDTVTAANPQLAAAIEAAAGGTPIADAFREEGIAIPPPGTAVADPVDPSRLLPGDIGMFTDRHALALGESRALVNGQIQHISTVNGPSFLGWEHPPVPVTTTPPPDRIDPPAPTRPATAERTESA